MQLSGAQAIDPASSACVHAQTDEYETSVCVGLLNHTKKLCCNYLTLIGLLHPYMHVLYDLCYKD